MQIFLTGGAGGQGAIRGGDGGNGGSSDAGAGGAGASGGQAGKGTGKKALLTIYVLIQIYHIRGGFSMSLSLRTRIRSIVSVIRISVILY